MKVKILRYFIFGTAFLFIAYIVYLAVPRMIEMGKRMYYSNPDNVENEMYQYLEKRYGEEFEGRHFSTPSFAQNYYYMEAYPKGQISEDKKFIVKGWKINKTSMEYFDTYAVNRLIPEYEEYVGNIIKNQFDEFKFYASVSIEFLQENLPSGITLYEFLQLKSSAWSTCFDVCIYLPPTDDEIDKLKEKVTKLSKSLSESNIRGSIQVKSYFDKEKYNEKYRDDWGKDRVIIGEKEFEILNFFIQANGNIMYVY